MNNHKKIKITEEGYEELKSEYKELTEVKRPETVERLETARQEGDLSENAAYHDAKDDLEFLDGRIDELKYVLDNAEVLDGNEGSSDVVDVGSKVKLTLNGSEHMFHIVGEWEADPTEKKISHESPLGKALTGKKVGEKVEVEAPAGKIHYEIIEIE